MGDGSVMLDKTWAIGKVGKERFHTTLNCHYLDWRDSLYNNGIMLGLSPKILEWLKSAQESIVLDAADFAQPAAEVDS